MADEKDIADEILEILPEILRHPKVKDRADEILKILPEILRNTKLKAMPDEILPETLRNAKLNALNSVALVAVLIATVTFAAGIDPPGTFNRGRQQTGTADPPGTFNQGGQQTGTAVVDDKASFEIFSIFNDLALFVSLFLVLVLSSFNLVKNTALEVLLGISTVIMWVAVVCMAAAYIAARWVVLPWGHWTWRSTVAIGGSLIFIAAGVLILVHARLMQRFPPISRFRRMDFSIYEPPPPPNNDLPRTTFST